MRSIYEIAYTEVIPEIRREIIERLRAYGMKETEIAQKLNITQAAVSKYLKNRKQINAKIAERMSTHKEAIEEYVASLIENKRPVLCTLCQKIGGFSCQLSKA